LTEDGSELVALRPELFFMVTKGDDATLGLDWVAIFVGFDCLDTHGRDNLNVSVLFGVFFSSVNRVCIMFF
jgi:hypothetical protein